MILKSTEKNPSGSDDEHELWNMAALVYKSNESLPLLICEDSLKSALVKLSPSLLHKTALVKVKYDLHVAKSNGKFSVLTLLDFQRYLPLFLSNLKYSLPEFQVNTLARFSSYLTDFSFLVSHFGSLPLPNLYMLEYLRAWF